MPLHLIPKRERHTYISSQMNTDAARSCLYILPLLAARWVCHPQRQHSPRQLPRRNALAVAVTRTRLSAGVPSAKQQWYVHGQCPCGRPVSL